MKVLITGGAGFVGTNLAIQLLEIGYEVKIFDDLSTGLVQNIPKDVQFTEASILDTDKLQSAAKDIEVIVHLGARGSVPRSLKDPVVTHHVNSTGTLNVLEAARANGSHYIFSSSSSVYGSNAKLPKNEDMVLRPLTPYAASKMSGEALSLAYAKSYGLRVSTFRFFNVFGPWQRPDHEYAAVIPRWVYKCIKGEEIEVYGDGKQTRDFTYIGTVVQTINKCIADAILHPFPVNLAYGKNISLLEVIELLKKKFPSLKINFLPSRGGDILDSRNNPDLIKSLYPSIKEENFENSLRKTIEWFESTLPHN
jgi:UDP-glucose 4-epimerase